MQYLTGNTINKSKELQWRLFMKLATVYDWNGASQVLSFAEDNWDALNTIQFQANYAARNSKHRQNNVNCQVRFEDSKDRPQQKTSLRCNNNNKSNNPVMFTIAAADDYNNNKKDDASNNSQHHGGNSGIGNDVGNTKVYGDAYTHYYNARFESGKAYVSGYQDGLADDHNTPLVSNNSYNKSGNNVSYKNNYKW